ncbi:GAF and ANTAR domain-containing protein [Nocardia mexicana]|uniref:ANTAR domain-containing protein n=1 Tax=Nocardia mexicana TaxID=279262 RepID=A0A370H5J1_9NOCA|nr:GAF and ANTAR domain-containing protein [Nocardia mexicana]RDI51028.1 ANTAR domain-containing protein [Nocardia mexicana]
MPRFEYLTERFLAASRARGGGVAGACAASVGVLPVQRAAIVIDEHHAGVQPWCTSDEVAAGVEAVQATVGEGPAVEAVATGMPVPVADLADGCERWPGFAEALARTRASGAMIAMPLRLGAIRFGALDLYRDAPGRLDARTVSAGLHIADLITTQLVLARSAGDPAEAAAAAQWLEQPLASRAIHQAAGMVVAQLGIGVPDAYARLRAYAFGHALSLAEVAEAVVARRIRFDGV